MKKIILDTNFILTCIRNKIDFAEDLSLRGLQVLIPQEVIKELRGISNSKKKLRFRDEANIALKLLEKIPFDKIELKEKNVDNGIIKFSNENKKVIIATLDKRIQNKIQNQKLIIRGKKKLELL
jgi:rRNA-processing protein FCF1